MQLSGCNGIYNGKYSLVEVVVVVFCLPRWKETDEQRRCVCVCICFKGFWTSILICGYYFLF